MRRLCSVLFLDAGDSDGDMNCSSIMEQVLWTATCTQACNWQQYDSTTQASWAEVMKCKPYFTAVWWVELPGNKGIMLSWNDGGYCTVQQYFNDRNVVRSCKITEGVSVVSVLEFSLAEVATALSNSMLIFPQALSGRFCDRMSWSNKFSRHDAQLVLRVLWITFPWHCGIKWAHCTSCCDKNVCDIVQTITGSVEKNCLSATLSTTNPRWTTLGSKLGLCNLSMAQHAPVFLHMCYMSNPSHSSLFNKNTRMRGDMMMLPAV
jgi:hypothetical protein